MPPYLKIEPKRKVLRENGVAISTFLHRDHSFSDHFVWTTLIFPRSKLQLGICRMHHLWPCLFCGWVFFRHHCLTDSSGCWYGWAFFDSSVLMNISEKKVRGPNPRKASTPLEFALKTEWVFPHSAVGEARLDAMPLNMQVFSAFASLMLKTLYSSFWMSLSSPWTQCEQTRRFKLRRETQARFFVFWRAFCLLRFYHEVPKTQNGLCIFCRVFVSWRQNKFYRRVALNPNKQTRIWNVILRLPWISPNFE